MVTVTDHTYANSEIAIGHKWQTASLGDGISGIT